MNRDVKHQEIFGFGGAFTDSTGINIKKIGDKLGNQILADYFSKDGLEYNVGRIPIGGSDFSPRAYALDDKGEDKSLHNFNLTTEDLNYKVDKLIFAWIDFMKTKKPRGNFNANTIILFNYSIDTYHSKSQVTGNSWYKALRQSVVCTEVDER